MQLENTEEEEIDTIPFSEEDKSLRSSS